MEHETLRQRSNIYPYNRRTAGSDAFCTVRPMGCLTAISHLQETLFSVRSVQRLCYEDQRTQQKTTPCGGGLEYFHRSPCES
jgi:hypothetical protein